MTHVIGQEASVLLYSRWHRESVLSGPHGMCFHPQYPIMKVCHEMRGENMDNQIMQNFRNKHGLNREFKINTVDPMPLEHLMSTMLNKPISEIREGVCKAHEETVISLPRIGSPEHLQLPTSSDSPYDRTQASLVSMGINVGMHIFEVVDSNCIVYKDSHGMFHAQHHGLPVIHVAVDTDSGMWYGLE